jgi:hypothetical protein
LTFNIEGSGVSIDPVTGEIAVETDALLDGVAITVTARNSGGEATQTFRLTVAMPDSASLPVEPPLEVAPSIVELPSLGGTGVIGTPVTVEVGTWTGTPEPALARQWLRDGAEIEGATDSTYLPIAADDRALLSCRVTAVNVAGRAEAETGPIRVVYAAPASVDRLPAVTASQGDAPVQIEVAAAFMGEGLHFAVRGANATIDPASGLVTIPTDVARTNEIITVTASNSGGAVSADFEVTIEAVATGFPPSIPGDLWSVIEVRDMAPAGRRRVSVSADLVVPAGYELRFYSGVVAGGEPASFNRVLQSGETFTTIGSMAIGTTCHNVLFWRRIEDNAWTQASENEVVFEIKGLESETPTPVLPVLVAAPVLSGTGKIGSEHEVASGNWEGIPAPTLEVQWLRNDEVIEGATAETYVPVADDDLKELRVRVTAANGAGSVVAEAGPIRISYDAPAVVAEVSDEIFDEATGPQAVPTAQAFAGDNLTFTVNGAGATIDSRSGVVSIPTDVPFAEMVTVGASNSGGAVSTDFMVTVEAASIDLPSSIPAALWAVVEVRDEEPAGRRRVTVSPEVVVPDGYELRFYSGPVAGGQAASFNRKLQPGETFTTAGSMAVGSTCHNVLFWWCIEDDHWLQASENEVAFQILGLDPVSKPNQTKVLPAPTAAMLSNAMNRGFPRYIETGSGNVNVGFNGGYPMTLALDVLAKGKSSPHYTWVRDMLKYVVAGGNEPACIGGYPTQHEMHVTSVAAMLRGHAIWDELTTAEKAKWDTLMRATLVTNAFITSDKNPYVAAKTQQRDLRGGTNLDRGWNPNYSAAMVPSMLLAVAYFGGVAQATAILEGFDVVGFASLAASQGLNHIARTYARTWGSNSPTATQIQNAIKGWTWWGTRLGEIETLLQEHVNKMWSATIQRGVNSGAGIGGCGTTILNLTPPNNGQVGMGMELDSVDAQGKRSMIWHTIGGYRCLVQTLIPMVTAGMINRKSATIIQAMARMRIGVADLDWRLNTAGYRDYGYGRCHKVWNPADPGDIAEWGLTYTLGLWNTILNPWLLDAAEAPSVPPPPPAPNSPMQGTMQSSVSIYGITGNMAAPREVFSYISGDPGVIYQTGQNVTFTGFNPAGQVIDGTDRHGLVLDYGQGDQPVEPGATGMPSWFAAGAASQGFDGRWATGRLGYNGSRNRDPGKTGQPLVIGAGGVKAESCIEKVRSHTDPVGGGEPRRTLQDLVRITVIPAAKRPAADAFRPASVLPDKRSPYRAADMKLNKWPNYGPLPAGAPNPAQILAEIQRPLQVGSRWDDAQRSINATNNQANYGRELALQHINAALVCCFDIPLADKRAISIALCQRGIDIDGVLQLGGIWMERGGILQGRKVPAFILGWLMEDPAVLTRTHWWGSQRVFHEDRQIFYMTQQQVNERASLGYVQRDVGMPEYQIHWLTGQPFNQGWSGPDAKSSYRDINQACLMGRAMLVLMLNAKAEWDYNCTIDYADRMRGLIFQDGFYNNTNRPPLWHRQLYAARRAEFSRVHPITWGPNFFGHR